MSRVIGVASLATLATLASASTPPLPAAPSHVVVVVLDHGAIPRRTASRGTPYLDSLIAGGAVFSRAVAVGRTGQANLLALFSGSTHRLHSDECQLPFDGPNLAQQLIATGRSFIGFSSGLPATGYRGCTSAAGYRRSHAPWANYRGLPADIGRPVSVFTATDFDALPTVSFVIAKVRDDAALRALIDPYVRWAQQHDALLVVTADGDAVPTVFVGPMVKPGRYAEHVDAYRVLRTIEELYALPPIGRAVALAPISDVWS
jgi:acid phosphatase